MSAQTEAEISLSTSEPDLPIVSAAPPSQPLSLLDLILLAILVLVAAGATIHSLGGASSSEDGAMLIRYSQHVADHQGITWNIGEHPVEGATDFLYMMSIAGVARLLHKDAVVACRLLLFVCWIALPLALFSITRFTLRANRWLAFAIGLYAASGPGAYYLQSFFGAPFMMLVVALAWGVGVGLIAGRIRYTWSNVFLFSLLALLIGLTRPEGNVLAVLLLLAIVFSRGWRNSVQLLTAFCAVFVLLGGAYFVWRVHYFGYLLPNPFYVKGGGHLHLEGLANSVENGLKILWPAIPLCLLALRNKARTRLLLTLLIPWAGFTGVWILLSNENNHLMRFQMPLLPVVLLFLPLLVENIFAEMGVSLPSLAERPRTAFKLAAAVYVLFACAVFHKTFSGITSSSGMAWAQHLSRYADRGYTMAVTEAGQFPYYSRWKAIDVLGLNDAYIAHHGLDAAYLDRYKPELILYHLYVPDSGSNSWLHGSPGTVERDFHAMHVLHQYSLDHHYILAAAYGSEPCSLNVFYIRPDTPDTAAIVDYIRNTPYYFLDSGILSVDYRDGVRPECHLPADLLTQ